MFKNLKSLFIEEDDQGDNKRQKKEPVAQKKTSPPKKQPVSKSKTPVSPSTGTASLKFMEILFRAMEDANLDGFDYLEFKQSLKSLEKMPMDEQTRFQSAFAMAQTMGATPAKLVQSANHYLKVLQREEQKFGEVVANQRAKQIGDKEKQFGQYQKAIKDKKDKINKLNVEIRQYEQIMNRIKKEISEATVKVESTKNDFHASYKKVVNAINKDVDGMKNFLK